MKKNEIGKQLKYFLEKENDIVKISRWAFKLYTENCRNFDPSTKKVLQCLFSMEDDTQFEYTQSELKLIAEMMINDENDPIKKINEMKAKD